VHLIRTLFVVSALLTVFVIGQGHRLKSHSEALSPISVVLFVRNTGVKTPNFAC
jgi:hypothetical protein